MECRNQLISKFGTCWFQNKSSSLVEMQRVPIALFEYFLFPVFSRSLIGNFIHLSGELARKYLSIPASQASCERLFSISKQDITETRTSMQPDLAEALLMLRKKKDILHLLWLTYIYNSHRSKIKWSIFPRFPWFTSMISIIHFHGSLSGRFHGNSRFHGNRGKFPEILPDHRLKNYVNKLL